MSKEIEHFVHDPKNCSVAERYNYLQLIMQYGTINHLLVYNRHYWISTSGIYDIIDKRQDFVAYMVSASPPILGLENADPFIIQYFRRRGAINISWLLLKMIDEDVDTRVDKIKPFFPYGAFIRIVRDYIVAECKFMD